MDLSMGSIKSRDYLSLTAEDTENYRLTLEYGPEIPVEHKYRVGVKWHWERVEIEIWALSMDDAFRKVVESLEPNPNNYYQTTPSSSWHETSCDRLS